MVRNTLTRLVLPVVLALLSSAAFAQVINYPLPQTQSSVNYNRGYGDGTFKVPWEDQGAIAVTINGVEYNFKFDLTVIGNSIVPAESKVEFCQTQMLTLGQVFKLERLEVGAAYQIFVNENMIDCSKLPPLPANVVVIPVRVDPEETIEQAVRMYEVIR